MEKQTHPPMHTAEHILNQTMIRLFGTGRCFSAHIEKKKSKCDYFFNRDLTPEEIAGLEASINDTINQNLPVTEETISYKSAQSAYNLEKLPTVPEKVRIIKVGDYDSCPCSGQHVAFTKEIGIFKIISTDFKDGTLRIRYKISN